MTSTRWVEVVALEQQYYPTLDFARMKMWKLAEQQLGGCLTGV